MPADREVHVHLAPQLVPAGGKPGTVANTNPPAGSKQILGSSIVIFVTNGQPPPATPGPTPAPGKPGPSQPPPKSPKPKPTHDHPPHNGPGP